MASQNKIYSFSMAALCAAMLLLEVHANIDTTTGPDLNLAIVLASTYTFTNFELARGKVQFRHGFTIPSGVTATLDVHDEVSETLTVSGTLNLAGDLFLGEGASIVTGGAENTIKLNGYTIFLQDDLTLTQSLNLIALPDGAIDGNNHRLVLPSYGELNVATPSALMKLKNITMRNCRPNNFNAKGNTVSVSLDNVTLQLAEGQQFVLDTGNIDVYRNVTCSPTASAEMTFHTTGLGDLSIHPGGTLFVGPGILFNYVGNKDIVFDDRSAFMHLSNSTFSYGSTTSTARLTKGTVIIEGVVNVNTSNPGGITIGDGSTADDLNMYVLPGAKFVVSTGTSLIYENSI